MMMTNELIQAISFLEHEVNEALHDLSAAHGVVCILETVEPNRVQMYVREDTRTPEIQLELELEKES